MDMTLVEHMWIAVAVQIGLAGILGLRGAGVAAVMVFLGREIAQNEYEVLRLPEFADMNLATLPWWAGLRHGWALGSVLDVAAPALACCLVALLWHAWQRWR
ncbi:hypothetical protein [Halomonas caseinilytica]|uniref:hypothetical protein n=1 Tax=Halomonas caseinilytica TaxID=438744 RepID=UPI000848B4D2|nr:hypothetical protein [Halomonas caseinilytica]